MAFHVLMCR